MGLGSLEMRNLEYNSKEKDMLGVLRVREYKAMEKVISRISGSR